MGVDGLRFRHRHRYCERNHISKGHANTHTGGLQQLRGTRRAMRKPHLPSLSGECLQAVQGWKKRESWRGCDAGHCRPPVHGYEGSCLTQYACAHARSVRGGWKWYLLMLSLGLRNWLLARCWTASSPGCASGRSAGESVAMESRRSPRQTIHCSAMPRRPREHVNTLESRRSHVRRRCCGQDVEGGREARIWTSRLYT